MRRLMPPAELNFPANMTYFHARSLFVYSTVYHMIKGAIPDAL
jgi:hypothetical protein